MRVFSAVPHSQNTVEIKSVIVLKLVTPFVYLKS